MEQIKRPPTILETDVATRWNSTNKMFKKLQHNRETLKRFFEKKRASPIAKERQKCNKKFTEKEEIVVDFMITLLQPLEVLSSLLSASKRETITNTVSEFMYLNHLFGNYNDSSIGRSKEELNARMNSDECSLLVEERVELLDAFDSVKNALYALICKVMYCDLRKIHVYAALLNPQNHAVDKYNSKIIENTHFKVFVDEFIEFFKEYNRCFPNDFPDTSSDEEVIHNKIEKKESDEETSNDADDVLGDTDDIKKEFDNLVVEFKYCSNQTC